MWGLSAKKNKFIGFLLEVKIELMSILTLCLNFNISVLNIVQEIYLFILDIHYQTLLEIRLILNDLTL